jgi:hypothetical protein
LQVGLVCLGVCSRFVRLLWKKRCIDHVKVTLCSGMFLSRVVCCWCKYVCFFFFFFFFFFFSYNKSTQLQCIWQHVEQAWGLGYTVLFLWLGFFLMFTCSDPFGARFLLCLTWRMCQKRKSQLRLMALELLLR